MRIRSDLSRILLLFLLSLPPAAAQDGSGAPDTPTAVARPREIAHDTSAVEVPARAESALRRYRSDDEFVYDREPEDPDSLWERFKRWLRSLFWSGKRTPPKPGSIDVPSMGVAQEFLIGAAAILIILLLVKSELRNIFFRRKPSLVTPIAEVDENIHDMSFEQLIDEAVERGDLRRAVRFLYLRSLKQLTDGGYIDWRKDKTNRDYLNELRSRASWLRDPFFEVTRLFDYVWYGNMQVDRTTFGEIRRSFDILGSTMTRRS